MLPFLFSLYIFFPFLLLYHYYHASALPQMRKYVSKIMISILILDYLTKFGGGVLLYEEIIDEDSAALFAIYASLSNCLLIFLLNKWIGPNINIRKIIKSSDSERIAAIEIICLLLLLADPLYTIDIWLWGCGVSGIIDIFNLIFKLNDISDCVDNEAKEALYELGYALFIAIVTYLIIAIGFLIFLFGRRSKGRSNISLSNITTKKRPLLFLRSFELNKSAVSFLSFDEHLCKGFPLNDQPIISLADPDTVLSNGTVQLQAEDDYWKEMIIKLFDVSKAVIMFEGKSDGLHWEIDNIRRHIASNRFFVATPPDDYRTVAWVCGDLYTNRSLKIYIWLVRHFSKKSIAYAFSFIWKGFCSRLAEAGIYLPKEQPGSGCLISFNEDWKVKEISHDLKGQNFFTKILSLIPKDDDNTIDYSSLYKSIEGLEVKGKIDQQLESRCKRFSKTISVFQLALLLIAFMIWIGYL